MTMISRTIENLVLTAVSRELSKDNAEIHSGTGSTAIYTKRGSIANGIQTKIKANAKTLGKTCHLCQKVGNFASYCQSIQDKG